jgi:hypothetical protein
MPAFPNSTTDIATAILTELDHFQTGFKPSGGALTGESQYSLKDEPCVGYAENGSEMTNGISPSPK